MTKYYEVQVTETCKAIGSKVPDFDSGFRITNEFSKKFRTIEEVKTYLKERYQNNKRTNMYQDLQDGKSVKVGHIYHGKDYEFNERNKKSWFWRQDWVKVIELKATTILI